MTAQSLPVSVPRDLPLESLPREPLLTQEFDRRPDLVYERLRRRYGQVAPVELAGVPVWLVLGYNEVRSVLQNGDLWRKETRHWRAKSEGRLPADWPILAGYQVRHMMFVDGAEHRGIRRTFETALRPYQDHRSFQARQLRLDIQQYADELVTMFTHGHRTGWVDLCSQYAQPLTLMVVNRLYGFPAEQAEDVMMDIWQMIDGSEDASQAVHRVREKMTALVAARQVEPRDDLPSGMLAADPALTPERLGNELFMISAYLSDVTCSMITNTLVELLDGNAEVRTSLSLGLIGEAVDSAAVANPPASNLTFRFPVQDTQLGQFTIAAGDPVIPSAAAAHADAFSHDTAANFGTKAHLAWGAGPHGCPSGARELATTIVTTAVARLTHWFATWQLALPPDQLSWRAAHIIRALRTLPVRFELYDVATEPKTEIDTQPKPEAATISPLDPQKAQPPSWRRFLIGRRTRLDSDTST